MITEQEITNWLAGHKQAQVYAKILWERYCQDRPTQYRYLARDLGLRGASQAKHYEQAALQRLRVHNPAAVEQAAPDVPQALWAALFGHWKPREVPR